jgi:hypothetical protein
MERSKIKSQRLKNSLQRLLLSTALKSVAILQGLLLSIVYEGLTPLASRCWPLQASAIHHLSSRQDEGF